MSCPCNDEQPHVIFRNKFEPCYFSLLAAILLGIEKEKFEAALTTLATTVDGKYKHEFLLKGNIVLWHASLSFFCLIFIPFRDLQASVVQSLYCHSSLFSVLQHSLLNTTVDHMK